MILLTAVEKQEVGVMQGSRRFSRPKIFGSCLTTDEAKTSDSSSNSCSYIHCGAKNPYVPVIFISYTVPVGAQCSGFSAFIWWCSH